MPASTEAQITEWIASQKQSMIDLLRDVVDIDSGSYDKAGVDAVGARFEQHLRRTVSRRGANRMRCSVTPSMRW